MNLTKECGKNKFIVHQVVKCHFSLFGSIFSSLHEKKSFKMDTLSIPIGRNIESSYF